ncbi:hypothetical protein Y032_0750g2039 [Ancylostoma ceylanicum]|uniref:Uncharacterized protein n=1 Tax=Ancylostoma ceylanicum TaxID=53326 RepID=A0A016WFE9_9BILA|nr:hypothetical protein Y032_0750g2039 [Ancylostoma ceylanicum]
MRIFHLCSLCKRASFMNWSMFSYGYRGPQTFGPISYDRAHVKLSKLKHVLPTLFVLQKTKNLDGQEFDRTLPLKRGAHLTFVSEPLTNANLLDALIPEMYSNCPKMAFESVLRDGVRTSLLEQIYVQRRASPLILSIGQANTCSPDVAAVADRHSETSATLVLYGICIKSTYSL